MATMRRYLSAAAAGSSPAYTSGVTGVLLDSIRDATFLGPSAGVDYGLGITDDPKFVFTSHYNPSTGSSRAYPVKFFWLGSPAGTLRGTDTFSIYMADVDPSGFSFGALPSSWLLNPRVVVNISQATSDVISWFDSNYPGGATAGVGSSNSGSATGYGTLAGGSSGVGNVSGFKSINGEYWPIYDKIDGSLLLFFSFSTPNCNTLGIYCYRLPNAEVTSPATASDFVGGLSGEGWLGTGHPGVGLLSSFTPSKGVLSSLRFSILSPDPLVQGGLVSGQQAALFAYSYGVFDGVTGDHGGLVSFSIVADIHSNPLSPGTITASIEDSAVDQGGLYPVDKLGSLVPCSGVGPPNPGYVLMFNGPSARDVRPGSNKTVISAMQLRALYFNVGAGTVSHGMTPLRVGDALPNVGFCRPQFTTLPDGLPKILYANFTNDAYLNLAYEYVDLDFLSPDRQKSIVTYQNGKTFNPIYAWGKHRAVVRGGGIRIFPGDNPAPAQGQSVLYYQEIANDDIAMFGANEASGGPTVLLMSQRSPYSLPGGTPGAGDSINVTLEDIPPWFTLSPIGTGASKLLGFLRVELMD
ncbi:MAG TPA: hypothetical protein VMH78_04460 [Thermoplasmata archaeon]|nr:hypothetical protein [Thermoplasmata archaeon]